MTIDGFKLYYCVHDECKYETTNERYMRLHYQTKHEYDQYDINYFIEECSRTIIGLKK